MVPPMNLLPPRPLLACALLTVAGALVVRAAEPTPTPAPAAPAASASPGAKMPEVGVETLDDSKAAAPAAPTPDPAINKEVVDLKTADSLWDYIKKYSNLDDIQPDATQPQDAQMAQARAAIAVKISHLQVALPAFLKDYPKDPHWWDAKLMRLFFLRDPENLSEKDVTAGLHEVADSKEAPMDARQQARGVLLENAVQEADPTAGLTDSLEKEISSYEKDFPDDSNGARFVPLRMHFLGDGPPEKTLALLKTLAASPNHATADAAKTQLALRTEPLDLKLKATDGQEIDLAKLRGKVVLLDFWATWCVPCMMKLPDVLAADKKYDAKDFQIIGVSLDQDAAALAKVTKQKGMNWPEINDPKGFEGEIPAKFGIEAIPAAWLLDRQGHAHPLALDANLDEEIAKLVTQK